MQSTKSNLAAIKRRVEVYNQHQSAKAQGMNAKVAEIKHYQKQYRVSPEAQKEKLPFEAIVIPQVKKIDTPAFGQLPTAGDQEEEQTRLESE